MAKKAPRDQELLIARQRVRDVERHLKLERTGLLAIARAFVRESPDPQRLLSRLDAMVQAGVMNRRTKAEIRSALVAGRDLVARAIEQEDGKPQGLFNPDLGHISPENVERVLEDQSADGIVDVAAIHRDRLHWSRSVRRVILQLIEEQGPQTDPELRRLYKLVPEAPPTDFQQICRARAELTARGQLAETGVRRGNEENHSWPVWDLTERVLKFDEEESPDVARSN